MYVTYPEQAGNILRKQIKTSRAALLRNFPVEIHVS